MIFHILLLTAFWVVANHFRNKIKNLPPTPFPTLPIIGHLYLLKQPLYRTLSKISARYGPIPLLKFGSRRVLLVSSPSVAEECLTKNDITFANRPNLLVGKHLGTITLASYGLHTGTTGETSGRFLPLRSYPPIVCKHSPLLA
ncbi:hypothetical protein Pint_08690 [Pistacia integerrima]|uniref:Uncharacterized protein n=1 Tax=Pistacia integerrima TaxID=434235 RepID=A0ACC0XSD7_9ROSI|nr:hypothetical protein Pint_08690 [Pistacia integerrima]